MYITVKVYPVWVNSTACVDDRTVSVASAIALDNLRAAFCKEGGLDLARGMDS